MRVGPQKLTPFYGPTRGFSYPKEIQPILDRHCVECHNDRRDKDVPLDLSGQPVHLAKIKRNFSRSYLELTHAKGTTGDWNHPMVNWIDSMSEPSLLPPYHRGAGTSKLMTLLENGHEKAKLSDEEMEKLACWIDLLVPYCGDYLEANTWSPKDHGFYARVAAGRKGMEQQERESIEALIEQHTPP